MPIGISYPTRYKDKRFIISREDRHLKRTLLALGLSALTLVGGHFFNRRWDRAVLLFVTLVLWGVGAYVAVTVRTTNVVGAGSGQALSDITSFHWRVFLYGVLALWVVSLAVTFLDARRSAALASYRWTVSGVIGAVGLSFVTFVLLLIPAPFLLFTAFNYVDTVSPEPGSSSTSISDRDRHFSNFVYFGRWPGMGRDPGKPPSGDGYLRGRFTYEGKPASGVSLSLALNGEYETARVTTDENGIFTVRLPSQEWTVNRLITHEWAERPQEGSFMIVSGTEPKLVGERYNEHYWVEREGIKITASNQAGEPQMNLTIRKRVALTWPRADEKPTPATHEKGIIAWEPYSGAETYLLQITELKREGRTTSFHPVTAKPIKDSTRFALASLAAVPGDEEKEYQASVLAFAKDGTFLSESSARFDDLTFVLTDKRQLVRDEERAFASGNLTTEELQKIRDNNRRIEAMEVLLKDGLLDEAEKVLAKIKGKVDPGKQAAIAGYLMAKRGRCDEAKRLFAKARSEGGSNCVPSYYRAACPE